MKEQVFTILSKHANEYVDIFRGMTIGYTLCPFCNETELSFSLYYFDGFKYLLGGYHITGILKEYSYFCSSCINEIKDNHDEWLFKKNLNLL